MSKKNLDKIKKDFLKQYPPWLTEIGETKVREMYKALGQTQWFFDKECVDKDMSQKILFAHKILAFVLRGGIPLEHSGEGVGKRG